MAKKRHAASGILLLGLLTFGVTLLVLMWLNSVGPEIFTRPPSNQITLPSSKDRTFDDWTEVSPGVEFKDISKQLDGKNYTFHLVRLDQQQVQMSIAHEAAGKSLRTWLGNDQGIVINAGFFKQENAPVGLLYINGRRIDDHRIRPQGTGILEIIGKKVSVYPLTSDMATEQLDVDYALQSFPLLIVDGQVNELTASDAIDRRTAIGMDLEQRVYLITVDEAVLSLQDFAEELLTSDVRWENVLNLDGGSSTGILANYGNFYRLIDTETFIPTVILVKK